MATLREQAADMKADMQAIVDRAKAESRDLTDDEATGIEAKATDYESLVTRADGSEKAQRMVADLASSTVTEPDLSTDSGMKLGTLGERFVKSEGFQNFRDANPSGLGSGTPVRIEAKGLGGAADLGIGRKAVPAQTTTTGVGQIPTEREPGYRNYLPVDAELTFLDLVTSGTTNQSYSEYAQIISETNRAEIVAEGELKPTSEVGTELKDSKAYTYADGFNITNQTLSDDGALATFLESRIRRHVRGVVEAKLFNGAGSGTEPEGILTSTGTLDQVFDTDIVVTIARALEKFQTNNGDSDPQAIVMNPADIWALRLLKGTDGHYLLGNPLQQGPIPTPWGVPLVRSSKLDEGTALVGRFDSVNFLELEPLNVLAFNQHLDFAQRNMVYVRAELRGRQLFYAPREVVVATISGT